MNTELYSTEDEFRALLASPLPIGEAEALPVIDFIHLARGVARGCARETAIYDLGTALQQYSVVLLDLASAVFSGFEDEVLYSLLTGQALEYACREIFSNPELLTRDFREAPVGGVEAGFYSFPLNSRDGGVRGRSLGELHAGLPRSVIWNYSAAGTPLPPAFADSQLILQSSLKLYCTVTDIAIEALAFYLGDQAHRLRELVGPKADHKANHIKLIHSPGATNASLLELEHSSGMVCRHRVHIDHCILTLNPPAMNSSSSGGNFFYYSRSSGRPCWRPLQVPSGQVALFAGVDLATFTRGTSRAIAGLPHQVLANYQESLRPRTSSLYRVTVYPDAEQLQDLRGKPFSFHAVPSPSGREYYEAVVRHRKGY